MKLTDIIALAKAGYKKDDIDELLQVPIDEPEPIPAAPDSTEPESGPEGGPEPSPEKPSPDQPDYEQLYKDMQKELEQVKNSLKVAQEMNRNASAGGNPPSDPWKDLEDIARSYM